MYYNIEVYSGVLIASEICRAYIYPEVDKFMDDEKIAQDDQAIVRDKIYEMIDMTIFEYHKKVRLAMQKLISEKIENVIDSKVNLVGDEYYDIYVTLLEEVNEETLVSRCIDLMSQDIDEINDSLMNDIKLAVNSIIQNELNKDFDSDIKLTDIVRDMEIIEVHQYKS